MSSRSLSSRSLTPRVSTSIDEEKLPADYEIHKTRTVAEGANVSPEVSSDPEKGAVGEVTPAGAPENTHEYITGVKLFLVMAGVTLVCFLMLLDTSIITTVCPYSPSLNISALLTASRPFLELLVTSTPSRMWAGMVVHTCSLSKISSQSHH